MAKKPSRFRAKRLNNSEGKGKSGLGRMVAITQRPGDGVPHVPLDSQQIGAEMKGCLPMSKKHFIALADHLRAIRPVSIPGERERFAGRLDMWKDTVQELADFCQSQNSEFKRDRWISYINGECGKNGGKV
jgi:hypothetical protein